MSNSKSRWVTVSDSPHDHEREALIWLKGRLPDREPFHVWTNFEFVTRNGQLYEIDALAITDNGVHLIEFKAHPGTMAGDGTTWQWTMLDGRKRIMDNPRNLANRKAKALKSALQATGAFRGAARDMPYLSECVFLSDKKLVSELSPQGRFQVFGRDADKGKQIPEDRANLGGIVDHLTSLKPDASGRPRKRIDRAVVAKLVRAVDQVGIREQASRKFIGDYQLGDLITDVGSDPLTQISYQDFVGTHRAVKTRRRVRIYPLEYNATTTQRETAARAARREHDLISRLNHRGIIRPIDYSEHERGPVLFFDYDPTELPLTKFMAHPNASQAPVVIKLGMIRQVAEAMGYAHGLGVYHRALSPEATLVSKPDLETSELFGQETPQVRITNWHTGAAFSQSEAGTTAIQQTGTSFGAVDDLSPSDAELFRAPEFFAENANPETLDIFSLGAILFFLLTGEAPAKNAKQLRSQLMDPGFLDPSEVVDGLDPDLVDLVIDSTFAAPSERFRSVEDFLAALDLIEEKWADSEAEESVDPTQAVKGSLLYHGRFEVLQRLGRGSTAIALLVKDLENDAQHVVLKVAENIDHNNRILDEAAALSDLQHANIVRLLDGPLDIAEHQTIVVSFAGLRHRSERSNRPERSNRSARTLADRLRDGAVGAELTERWGTDLLDALRYLEQMGTAHRDIKPENLGVQERGASSQLHLMLFDFSLSNAPIDQIDAGTPGYTDPFLVNRHRWDPAADRYSATVTLFELATGRRPRYGDGTADPVAVPQPPDVDSSMFDSSVAEGLTKFFLKALQPDAKDRFDTADEMAFAWIGAFKSAVAPSTPTHHPSDEFVTPPNTEVSASLASLPLSRRAVDALASVEVLTIDQLLSFPRNRVKTISGVGRSTRADIYEARDVLEETFPDFEPAPVINVSATTKPAPSKPAPSKRLAVAQPSRALTGAGSAAVVATSVATGKRAASKDAAAKERPSGGELEVMAERLAKAKTASLGDDDIAVRRVLLGLDERVDPLGTLSELAATLGLDPNEVEGMRAAAIDDWQNRREVEDLTGRVSDGLLTQGVRTLDSVVGSLVSVYRVDNAVALGAARGLIGIASLAQERIADTDRLWAHGHVRAAMTLATAVGRSSQGRAVASELFTYARRVADLASQLVTDRSVISRVELLSELDQLERPELSAPIPDAHLADLAGELCVNAAVNRRMELYRSGLEPLAALRASRRALISGGIDVEGIRNKLRLRFPEAADIPERPELDGLLHTAGHELRWDDKEHEYSAPLQAGTQSRSMTFTRVATNAPAAIEVDDVVEFDQRLDRSHNSGGLFVLVVDDVKKLPAAERSLGEKVDFVVDVDAWLTDQLNDITADGKPGWPILFAADGEGPHGAQWTQLRRVIDNALVELTKRLVETSGTVLLTNLGLLARYDRLDLVAAWREHLHSNAGSEAAIQAIWILVPATVGVDAPMVDGHAIPVISGNEWANVPIDWLRNASENAR